MLSCLMYFYVSSKCLVCIVVRWIVCKVVVLCMQSSYEYCGHLMCMCGHLMCMCGHLMCICCTECVDVLL
jgi:hypothetical protein